MIAIKPTQLRYVLIAQRLECIDCHKKEHSKDRAKDGCVLVSQHLMLAESLAAHEVRLILRNSWVEYEA